MRITAQPLPNVLGVKSRFEGPDGVEITVEQLALQHYARSGAWEGRPLLASCASGLAHGGLVSKSMNGPKQLVSSEAGCVQGSCQMQHWPGSTPLQSSRSCLVLPD